jgi:hydroxymethylpyrimidine pyrophosphatase-like HAD family hydrolase
VWPTIWTADAWYIEDDGPYAQLLATLLERDPVVEPLEDVINREEVVKVMVGAEPDLLDSCGLDKMVPGMERSMSTFMEASPPGASKADALRFLLDYVGVNAADAWGFGDGGNDREWLSIMGRAYAPSNARDEIKSIAHEVIGHHAEESVATFLDPLF